MAVAKGTLYDRLLQDLEHSSKIKQEVASGRRIGFYRLKSHLGSGNFAQVKLGLHLLTNEKVAVKIIDKTKLDDTTSKLLSREISCMERLCHRNLVQLFEILESFSRLCLVMECAAEGNLQSRVEDNGPFPEAMAKPIFSQMAAGVGHMHAHGVTHRDLKPENVLYVSRTQVKIADFGFSTPNTDTLLSTFCGSPAFAAPELMKEQNYLGPPVDVWALGATLYYMVTGNIPYPGNSVAQIKENVLRGSYLSPSRVGSVCKELIAQLLAMDPSQRPSVSAVLQQDWLSGEVAEDAEPSLLQGQADPEVVAEMKQLGVPVGEDISSLLAEPRTAAAGTYRILLHNKLQSSLQRSLQTPVLPTTATNTRSRKKSSICNIL